MKNCRYWTGVIFLGLTLSYAIILSLMYGISYGMYHEKYNMNNACLLNETECIPRLICYNKFGPCALIGAAIIVGILAPAWVIYYLTFLQKNCNPNPEIELPTINPDLQSDDDIIIGDSDVPLD